MLPSSPDLKGLFPSSTYDAWAEAIGGGERDAAHTLARETIDGAMCRALYGAHDARGVSDAGQAPFTRGRSLEPSPGGWLRCQRVRSLGSSMRGAVRDGATAIEWYGAQPPSCDDVASLPSEVPLVMTCLARVPDDLVSLLASREARGGAMGLDPLGLAAMTGRASGALPLALGGVVRQVAACSWPEETFALCADVTPYHHAGCSDAQAVGFALATQLAWLRAGEAEGVELEAVARWIQCRFALTPHVWSSVASVRALRMLWSRMLESCGVEPMPLWVHAVPSLRVFTRRAPENNLLRNTLSVVAGALGGADAITSLPMDVLTGSSEHTERLALTTQHVLAEEARLAQYVDLAGGSWRLEAQTSSIAARAWGVVQAIEERGGMAEALASGWVGRQVADVAQTRSDRGARRVDGMVGVSRYVVSSDRQAPLVASSHQMGSKRVCEALPVRRDAEAFERLVDACQAEPEGGVKVCLLPLGDSVHHAPRVTWATHLMAAAGLEAPRVGEPSEVLEGSWVWVCGSDGALESWGPDGATALLDGGAAAVTVVGLRGVDAEAWADAGVSVVHEGVDVVAWMKGTLAGLGVQA